MTLSLCELYQLVSSTVLFLNLILLRLHSVQNKHFTITSRTSPVSTGRIKTTTILELCPRFCQVPSTATVTFASCLLFILTIFSGLLISEIFLSY